MSELPWFRFFASDWLSGTRGMSAVETGVYITLIATMYERGEPVPDDRKRLARLCGASNAAFSNALDTLISEGKIILDDGLLWNDRVEKEINFRAEKSQVGSQNANARWGKKYKKNKGRNDATALQTQCKRNAIQKPEAISSTEANASVSPEPEKSAPVACRLPMVSGDDFDVLESDVSEWCEAFPAVDVRQQLLAMRSWLNANPNKRKTPRGIKRFIVSWLDREQNRSRGSPPIPPRQHRDSFRQAIRELSGSARNEPDQPDTRHDNTGNGGADWTGSGTVIDLLAIPGRR